MKKLHLCSVCCLYLFVIVIVVNSCAQPSSPTNVNPPETPPTTPVPSMSFSDLPLGTWKTRGVDNVQNGITYTIYELLITDGTSKAKYGMITDYTAMVESWVSTNGGMVSAETIWAAQRPSLLSSVSANQPNAEISASTGSPFTITSINEVTSSMLTGSTVVVDGNKLTITTNGKSTEFFKTTAVTPTIPETPTTPVTPVSIMSFSEVPAGTWKTTAIPKIENSYSYAWYELLITDGSSTAIDKIVSDYSTAIQSLVDQAPVSITLDDMWAQMKSTLAAQVSSQYPGFEITASSESPYIIVASKPVSSLTYPGATATFLNDALTISLNGLSTLFIKSSVTLPTTSAVSPVIPTIPETPTTINSYTDLPSGTWLTTGQTITQEGADCTLSMLLITDGSASAKLGSLIDYTAMIQSLVNSTGGTVSTDVMWASKKDSLILNFYSKNPNAKFYSSTGYPYTIAIITAQSISMSADSTGVFSDSTLTMTENGKSTVFIKTSVAFPTIPEAPVTITSLSQIPNGTWKCSEGTITSIFIFDGSTTAILTSVEDYSDKINASAQFSGITPEAAWLNFQATLQNSSAIFSSESPFTMTTTQTLSDANLQGTVVTLFGNTLHIPGLRTVNGVQTPITFAYIKQ